MNGHRILIWFAVCGTFLSSLAGCTAPASTDSWVVIPESRLKELGIGTAPSSNAEVEGYWTPTEDDILFLEEKLPSFLREQSTSFHREPPVWEQLDTYKRQYAGVIVNGRKIVYGNFFCTDAGIDWKKNWVFVLDGGDCFFQFQLDVADGTFRGLTVNGDA